MNTYIGRGFQHDGTTKHNVNVSTRVASRQGVVPGRLHFICDGHLKIHTDSPVLAHFPVSPIAWGVFPSSFALVKVYNQPRNIFPGTQIFTPVHGAHYKV